MLDKILARHLAFAGFASGAALVFHAPLGALIDLSIHDARYSHIAVIPLVAVFLACLERRRIFEDCRRSVGAGVTVLLAGIVTYAIGAARSGDQNDNLSLTVCAIVLLWTAGFILCYGTRALRAAVLPLGLLVFMIPIPTPLLDGINAVLQKGSADVTYALLKLAGAPVLRDGMRVSLPGVEIEIGQECSGVRSAFALLITGILAGHIFLRKAWARVSLAILTVPIAIFKNGVRIATLSWLASYVDDGILQSVLHRRGGLPFSLLALMLLVPVLFALRRSEMGWSGSRARG